MGTNQRSQITMSDEEIDTYLRDSRTATLATVGPSGRPHLVAMWYGYVDGAIWFETKAKSQKVTNLRRDDAISVLVEDGSTYDTLRGVELEGTGVVVDDADAIWDLGVDMWERYNGPYSDEVKPMVEVMVRNRVAIRVDVERVRSWDHRKLGMGPVPYAGSTAATDPRRVGEGASPGAHLGSERSGRRTRGRRP